MTRRKRKRFAHTIRLWITVWGSVIAVALSVTLYRTFGWILATALISGCTYMLGLRQAGRTGRLVNRLRSNAAYGKLQTTAVCPACHGNITTQPDGSLMPHTRVLDSRGRFGACLGSPAYLGGSYPRERVTKTDTRSAYPAELIEPYERVRAEVANGLAAMGWSANTTREPVNAAMQALLSAGMPLTTESALRIVLSDHADKTVRRIDP